MAINPNHPVTPQRGMDENVKPVDFRGLTKLEYLIASTKDDFDSLHIADQIFIAGEPPSYTYDPGFDEITEVRQTYGENHAKWLLKGRAKWRLMQAEALIEELNKEVPNEEV